LISLGHPPHVVWKYTPRQLAAWVQLSDRRRQGELAQIASIIRMAQSSDNAAVRKQLKQLQDESQ
jgi:transposase